MASHLPRGVASTCVAPGLVAHVLDDAGLLVAPFELGFRIYDASTSDLREAPAQVWPADPNDEVAVDTDLCADGGHGLGVGRYVAAFTPAASWRLGRYEIEWRLQLANGDPDRRWREPFDLLATTLFPRGPTHVLLSQLREAGVTAGAIGDVRLLEVVVRHSRLVEKMTRRRFGARFERRRHDGQSGSVLLLSEPIIALEAVRVSSALDVTVGEALLIDNEDLKVFSRHVSQGLLYPDDRAMALEERLRVGEGLVKTIFIHAYMDVHTFEVDRIKKCCTHYPLPDGRLMPGCAYNNIYRDKDGRYTGDKGMTEIWNAEEV